jgi:hypothetical protein
MLCFTPEQGECAHERSGPDRGVQPVDNRDVVMKAMVMTMVVRPRDREQD